jgi:hypothetical protein
MEILIFTLCFIAAYHFIYEGILAPSFRLELRFELFRLRDEVRQLKIESSDALLDKHFNYLQDSINALISFLYKFDFATLLLAEAESRRNPAFKKRVEERARILDDCNIQRARDIRKKSLVIAAKALVINSGACILYLIPIALVLSGYSAIKSRIRLFASFSDKDFERFSIDDDNKSLCPT